MSEPLPPGWECGGCRCWMVGVIGTNWSGTYVYRAAELHRPRSVDELQELIGRGKPVHALGTRHSFNDVADSAELISLSDLPGEVAIDSTRRTVRVPSGVRYGELTAQLEVAGWALANLASLPHISVAGSVATATHGSGNANQSLASAVVAMTMVDGRGELVEVTEDDPAFAGLVVHLGALGVVTDLTLRIEPSFLVRQDVYQNLPWPQLDDSFEAILGAGYSVSVITDFARDDVDLLWVKTRIDPGTDSASGQEMGARSSMPPTLFGATAATEKLHMTRGNDPRFCTPQLGEVGPWSERLAHFLLEFTPSSGAEIQSEFLMDRRHGPDAIEALRGLGHLIASLVKSAEIRTIAADELWLSPAYETDVFGVHFTWEPDSAKVSEVVAQIETALEPFSPRPHWAKMFSPHHEWAALYPRLVDFISLAERFDPEHIFRSPFLDRTIFASMASSH